MTAQTVIPGEREAKLSVREGDPTFSLYRCQESWVPFPHIGAFAPMLAGNAKGAW
jgi:hypothetical protein